MPALHQLHIWRVLAKLLPITEELCQLLGHMIPVKGAIWSVADDVVASSLVTDRTAQLSYILASMRRILISLEPLEIGSVFVNELWDRNAIDFDSPLDYVIHHVWVLTRAILVDQQDPIWLSVAFQDDSWLPLVLLGHLGELFRCQLELLAQTADHGPSRPQCEKLAQSRLLIAHAW